MDIQGGWVVATSTLKFINGSVVVGNLVVLVVVVGCEVAGILAL